MGELILQLRAGRNYPVGASASNPSLVHAGPTFLAMEARWPLSSGWTPSSKTDCRDFRHRLQNTGRRVSHTSMHTCRCTPGCGPVRTQVSAPLPPLEPPPCSAALNTDPTPHHPTWDPSPTGLGTQHLEWSLHSCIFSLQTPLPPQRPLSDWPEAPFKCSDP